MWLSLAFLSAFLLGFYDVFKKKSLRDNAVIPVLFLNTFFCSLIFLPAILASHSGFLTTSSNFFVPSGEVKDHMLIILKSAIVLSSWVLGYFGIKNLPLTIVGPINATRPVWALLGAIVVFGERLNLCQWIGVALAILSFFLLSKSGKKEGIDFKHNKWIVFVVLSSLLGAVSGLYDKFLMAPIDSGGAGLSRTLVQSWYNLYQCLMMGVMLLLLWMPHRDKTTPFRWDYCIVLISLFLSTADYVYFQALSEEGAMISIVSMVRRGSVVVSFLFGAMIFGERNLKSKMIDLLFVILGMVFLWIGGR